MKFCGIDLHSNNSVVVVTDGSVGRVGSADHSAREKRDVCALGLDVRPANGRPLLFTFVQGIL